jgi:hypothetical protein
MKACHFSILFLFFIVHCVASTLEITTTTVPNGTVGDKYSATIAAKGGCAPYTWTIGWGKLPAGVTDKASGSSLDLSGSPTEADKYNFTPWVTDCEGDIAKQEFSVTVAKAPSTLEITTTTVPNGTVGDAYSATIKAKGGCTPYKWKVESGKLPTGITDEASANTKDLDLSGTPTEAESYSFTISVTDCDGNVAKEPYSVTIQKAEEHVVSLKWDASKSKDVAGYNVYRGPDGVKWTKINAGLVPATDYDDSTVSNDSTYYYAATSVDIEGEESKKTPSVKIFVPE